MNANDRRLWLDGLTARYLEAVEADDYAAQEELWTLAAQDAELETAFREIHEGLIEEELTTTTNTIADAVAKHMPSATIVRDATGTVTFADVADEMFRNPPAGLPTEAWRLNDELRSSAEPLPRELGLSKLIEFAEVKFGVAPREFWKAFREAAIVVRMRSNSQTTDYQLAARRAPKPEDRP